MAIFDDCELIEANAEHIIVKHKNGNIMEIISSGNIRIYNENAETDMRPTYEELYEHWLRTKGKSKKKYKVEQLPGQLDVFDIIDNKTE